MNKIVDFPVLHPFTGKPLEASDFILRRTNRGSWNLQCGFYALFCAAGGIACAAFPRWVAPTEEPAVIVGIGIALLLASPAIVLYALHFVTTSPIYVVMSTDGLWLKEMKRGIIPWTKITSAKAHVVEGQGGRFEYVGIIFRPRTVDSLPVKSPWHRAFSTFLMNRTFDVEQRTDYLDRPLDRILKEIERRRRQAKGGEVPDGSDERKQWWM